MDLHRSRFGGLAQEHRFVWTTPSKSFYSHPQSATVFGQIEQTNSRASTPPRKESNSMDIISGSWSSMAITGKLVVTVLMGMSIYSYAIMVDRGVALYRARRHSADFAADAEERVQDVDQLLTCAEEYEQRGSCSLAAVVSAGLEEYKALRDDEQSDAVVVEGVDEGVSRALDVAVINLRQRLTGMATISGVAPFLGLFGTVTGLIAAFHSIKVTGSGGLDTVSGGISEALVTTVIGLFVAIPALSAYNFFMNRIDVMTIELDNAASRLVSRSVRRALKTTAS
jgi:biopolymer transport protein ExbB/TolQ